MPDYNKKFNELLDLANQYDAAVNKKDKERLKKKIYQGYKELNQNISKLDNKNKAKLEKYNATWEKQFAAMAKHDSKLDAIQNAFHGANLGNTVSDDQIEAELKMIKELSDLEKKDPNYKRPNNAELDEMDEDEEADRVASYFIDWAALERKTGIEEDLDFEEMFADLPPEIRDEAREEWETIKLGPAPTLDDFNAFEKKYNSYLVEENKHSPDNIATSVNKFLDLAEEAVEECEKKLPEIAHDISKTNIKPAYQFNYDNTYTTQTNKAIESMYPKLDNSTHTQPILNTAITAAPSTFVSPESPSLHQVEARAKKIEEKAQKCLSNTCQEKEKLGTEFRKNPKLSSIAASINELLQSLSNIKKNINAFCLSPIKAIKNFFGLEKETAITKVSEATVKMDTAQNNLINRQQDLLNQLQAKKQKFKNAPTKQAKINLLREIKEIKKEIIRNKKILANTENIKKCYKTEAQKLMQNPELEVKLSRKNPHS